jgi:hypothetical protein
MYPCPCCGYEVFAEPPGSYDICPICFWEDDAVQLAFPDLAGGANGCSLIEGQQNYAAIGASEERLVSNVRTPMQAETRSPEWRPLDVVSDRYLKWGNPEDHAAWRATKDREVCLYYWLPQYWLKKNA